MSAMESRGQRLAMLAVLSAGALLSAATTVGISPFLLDIARDLKTDLAAAGNLVALGKVSPWGLVSLFAERPQTVLAADRS